MSLNIVVTGQEDTVAWFIQLLPTAAVRCTTRFGGGSPAHAP